MFRLSAVRHGVRQLSSSTLQGACGRVASRAKGANSPFLAAFRSGLYVGPSRGSDFVQIYKREFSAPPRPPVPPQSTSDWEEAVSDDNKVYYWNRKTNETQWEVPPGMEREEWRELKDEAGNTYWWNTYTGDTTWNNPSEAHNSTTQVADYTPRNKLLKGEETHTPPVINMVNTDALVVQRIIEWANVVIGFEQGNKYEIKNSHGHNVGYIAEEESSFINIIKRQILRTHRPFKVTVFDANFDVLFVLDRPFFFISSTMNILDSNGEQIGEVLQRWHPWQRNYDLYLRKRQFASINGGFLTWDFTLTNEDGIPIGHISKQMLGIMREIVTDGNQYVLYMENLERLFNPEDAALSKKLEENEMSVDERLIALGAAITIDFDYFSRSGGHGLPIPFFGVFGGSHDFDEERQMGAGTVDVHMDDAEGVDESFDDDNQEPAHFQSSADGPYDSGDDWEDNDAGSWDYDDGDVDGD